MTITNTRTTPIYKQADDRNPADKTPRIERVSDDRNTTKGNTATHAWVVRTKGPIKPVSGLPYEQA